MSRSGHTDESTALTQSTETSRKRTLPLCILKHFEHVTVLITLKYVEKFTLHNAPNEVPGYSLGGGGGRPADKMENFS
jgi:hypothetical protein